jgi:hypothetical protein
LSGRLYGSGEEMIYRECIPQRRRPTGTEAVHVTIVHQRVRRFEEIVLHNIWVWRHLNGPRRNDSTASSHLHATHFPYLSQVPE